MGLEIQPKKNDLKTLLVLWEGEIWREVSKSLFFNELKKFPPDLAREEFLARFLALEEKIGKRYSIYLLAQRALLTCDLEAKLVAKGLSKEVAKSCARYCHDKGFLDDSKEIARLVAKELRKGLSAKAIYFKLKNKGVDEEQLREHLQESSSNDADALRKWLSKNAHNIPRSNPAEMRKLMAKLCRKGFSPDLVFKTLGDI